MPRIDTPWGHAASNASLVADNAAAPHELTESADQGDDAAQSVHSVLRLSPLYKRMRHLRQFY